LWIKKKNIPYKKIYILRLATALLKKANDNEDEAWGDYPP
jgi:tRNA isopentenyl-2-thiomethyl-A-37 hydroxylase MiaE